jgi:hypothetical protein
MTIRKSRDKSSAGSDSNASSSRRASVDRSKKSEARNAFRKTLLEALEERKLLAAGPQLIGVQPNNSDLIVDGVVRDVSPRELLFRFDDAQMIDPATTGGIRLTRSGGDGTFGLNSAATDFGSNGRVDIQLTMKNPGQSLTVSTTKADLGAAGPSLNIVDSGNTSTLQIVLNSNVSAPTSAAQLVNAINSTSGVSSRVTAKINGGFADTKLGTLTPTNLANFSINRTNDVIIQPGSTLVGSTPNENEVTVRFAEVLPDDFYRIEVFGFDDVAGGIVGIKNVATVNSPAEFLQPRVAGTRQDTINFRLDLGSKIVGVVPQPVVRNTSGALTQQRDTIVVYFDSDKILVENDSSGNPTSRSAENPDFYQLIYTAGTIRNTDLDGDDVVYRPTSVRYNASNNTATLTFASDIDNLRPSGAPRAAYRLRVGTRESIPFAPQLRTVAELGDTYTTADNLGIIGSASTPLTSVILTSEIKTTTLGLDRLGASNDPGHRDLGTSSFENHVNELFSADSNPGITQVFYNFKSNYLSSLTNSISDRQKERIREALQIWSNYLGIQFVESASQGITFSTGITTALSLDPSVQSEPTFNYRVRIDSTFNNSLLVMDSARAWNDSYGEDYFRIAMTAIGMLLGLEHAGDLPDSTLLSMNSTFLNATPNSTSAAVTNFEPIFPGSQDVLHGQFVHRPDNSDIDLYRFEIDFGQNGSSRVGEFVAETFAERRSSVSGLDTNLRLYKQKQATAVSNFNALEDLAIEFTATAPGQLGNHLQIVVTQSPRGSGATPGVSVSPNLIAIDLNSTPGSETTAGQLIAAIQGNSQANSLVKVVKLRGSDNIKIGGREIVYSPIELLGGKLELIAQNDDYFSEDSLLRLALGSGVYYVGVSASGNNDYDPAIPNSGTGGRTEGGYDLRLTFRAQTDAGDSIQDTIGLSNGDLGRSLDGDADGVAGGVYDFWFETRGLNRVVSINGTGVEVDGEVVSITGSSGVIRRFELSTDAVVGGGNILVSINASSTSTQVATALANAINGQSALLVTASTSSGRITLNGDRIVQFSTSNPGITAEGKTIFVDKLAGPNADGSQAKPFNSIQGQGVPNAFGSTLPGDIVRIVGNGGTDGNISTIGDNFAYEFGFGLLPNSILSDGSALEVPKGVVAMIDAGAVFKSRRSYLVVGSTNTGIDRSGSNLQVLGTPSQPVYFTSWLDEAIGRDSYGPSTSPSNGDWGGIIFQRNVDRSQGRRDKEDEGIFLNYVNGADIRYGGGGGIFIDANQQTVNPIQVVDGRPTITNNVVTRSASAAMSATPNSFEETLFTDPRFQSNGRFTPDYDRVGPDIHGNRFVQNSLNGLFINIQTLPGEALRTVSLAARFDDVDTTHILTENLVVDGTPGGAILDATKPDITFLSAVPRTGGSLPAGTYNYRVVFVDRFGVESISSDASSNVVMATNGSLTLSGLPIASAGYTFARVYRSDATGSTTATYSLIAQLGPTDNSVVDAGQDLGGRLVIPSTPSTAALRPRLDASLVFDPGLVLKIEGSRIELGQGTQLLAEGTEDAPIVITSKLDDRAGAGGTFDTNNDGIGGTATQPAAGNWGGIYVPSGADVSLDHVLLAFGGGVTRLEGTFRSFNILELQQGTARVANSRFESNGNGIGGQGPVDRFGRLNNEEAVVFARGTVPIFINNAFENNNTSGGGLQRSSAITLDQNSFTNELQGDRGRNTGLVDRLTTLDFNRGPLFRGNSFNNNDINGLEIRADNRSRNTTANTLSIEELRSDGLTVESVWDDTDIVHVLFDGIFVNNLAHASGFRLQSSPTESLVVKMSGAGSNFDPLRGSGFTAGGTKSSIDDRVGGMVHIIGQPGFPVILTSLEDDTAGAGLRPDGKPQNDTNNNGIATIPRPGDWRGVLLDQNSNDRNVVLVLEKESPNAAAPGINSTIGSSESLGQLATNANNSDENLRLGFVVKGVLSQPEDIDVYSFTGVAGTEVWIDIDHTAYTLDTVVELLDANGNLLARSDNSGAETAGTSSIVTTGLIQSSRVNPLAKQTAGNVRRNVDGSFKEDGTTNARDAGMRVLLPGANGTRTGYFFRVRSAGININNPSGGLTGGSYEVQVRMREAQEFAGSLVTGADIRYATNGIHLRGLPAHSPLLGEASEDESVGTTTAGNNFPWSYQRNVYASAPTLTPISTGIRPQYIGNVLQSDRAALSVAGNISSSTDVDFYRFSLTEADLVNSLNSSANLVFDLDYADGLNRADTSLAVYRLGGVPGVETWQLIYVGEGSNISDDQRAALTGSTPSDFTRGSLGTNDPFINTSTLNAGDYLVAVYPSGLVPTELASTPGVDILRIDDSVAGGGQSYTIDLTGILASQNPTFQFRFDDFTSAYTFSINGVNRSINGSGNFTTSLSAFAGTVVTLVFPGLPNATPPAVPPTITGLARLADGLVGSISTRIPFSRLSTPQLNTLFTTPLNITTRQEVDFDLSGYVAADLPAAYFNYNLTTIDYNVTIDSPLGLGDPAVFLTGALAPTNGLDLQAKIDLTRYAGLAGVKLVFTPTGSNFSAVSRVMVGLAERGESVTAPIRDQSFYENRGALFPGQTLFNPSATVPTTQQTGRYQLEIRRVDAPVLASSNDRDAVGFGLVVPSASSISDGNFFAISDAAGSVEFEFNSAGGFTAGRVPINIVVSPVPDSAAVVAGKIRDAINSAGVQSRLDVQASGADGLVTGSLTGNRVILVGATKVTGFFSQASSNLLVYSGGGDLNVNRDQGQVVVSGNTIRQSRDYGVWSEAGLADYDPRDLVDTFSLLGSFGLSSLIDNGSVRTGSAIIQSRPRLVGNSPGAVRNLQELNDDLIGGFNTGIVVTNNILEQGGLGGVHIAGENPIWMISPLTIPGTDALVDTSVDHFGALINDGDQFFIDSGRTRVGLEFEDVTGAGSGTPNFGSSTPGGDGWRPSNVPVYYREDEGATYLRSNISLPLGYTALESIHALRDAINGSILVTNGTTQRIEATVAMSLLAPIQDLLAVSGSDGTLENQSPLNWANRPALFLEGPANIYYRGERQNNIWDIRRVDRANTPQPFARVVNNTVIGNDGRASFTFDTNNGTNTAVNEPNDLLSDAVQTQQGTSIKPESFTMRARIGDNALLANRASDVDLYQFKLDIGDRVKVDIDTNPNNQPVDTVLQLYDAGGQRVNLKPRGSSPGYSIDNAAAPGETLGIDPYLDFTATVPGVYYLAVSAAGNLDFDPQSTSSRSPGVGTGIYDLELSVLQPNEFTITVEANADGSPIYQDGDTFTIYQVADRQNSTSNSLTFEFTADNNFTNGNIPVFFTADYRLQDMARSIAGAISNAGLNNDQNLDNGTLGGANPLNAVSAVALGGASGVQPGLRLFARRADGVLPTHSSAGIGHDLVSANGVVGSAAFGTGPTRADGAGTTEKFVVVRNAAAIESTPAPIAGNANRRSIQVDPDLGTNYNLNQLLPESGILVSAGSSPTLLNNVFYNVQTPIVREETRSLPNVSNPFDQDPLPFGSTNPNAVDRNSKPGEIIVGGNSYQFIETQVTFNRLGFGIHASPTNILNTQNDFNVIVTNNEVLFVNPQARNWLPASGARIIDSSIDSLTERDKFNIIKSAAGIAPSPILAPSRDAFGQLRVDDPTVAPPLGLGANVFKDRGALDNADFVGPTARMLRPIDNDSELIDRDPSISNVQLTSGVYPEFRIQLLDIGDSADPFTGVGIDDDSVLGPNEPPLRLPGTVLTISENGRTLEEGIDYVFAYNPTTKEIILTPLAGVWRNSSVFEIRLNNRDRFVLQAVSGNLVADGQRFQMVDSQGGVVNFEYDSGYRLQLPTSLRLQVPIAGGGAGGVVDGDRFTILVPGVANAVTFEMDRNDNTLPGNQRISFLSTDNRDQLADKIVAAIATAGIAGLTPRKLSDGSIFIGGPSGTALNIVSAALSVPQTTIGFQVPAAGPLPGGVTDGQTFSISDGIRTVTFEIDADNNFVAGRQRVDTSASSTATDVANQILAAIIASRLSVQPERVDTSSILLGLPSGGTANVGTSRLSLVGVSKSIADGQSFSITYAPVGGSTVTRAFEFDTNGTVAVNRTPITISNSLTEEEVGELVAQAITSGGLSLTARHIRNGNIQVGGTAQHSIVINPGTDLKLFGVPGVTAGTSINVQGTLVLTAPVTGGAGIIDGSTLAITNNGQSVVFEFDSNNLVNPGRTRIPYSPLNTQTEIAGQIAASIQAASGLGIAPFVLSNGRVDIGFVQATQVVAQPGTGIALTRGNVTDGETFTVNNGTTSVTFEYDNTTLNNGRTAGNVPILFSSTSTIAQMVASTQSALLNAGLGLIVTTSGSTLIIDDTPRFVYNFANAPSLVLAGLPGGAFPINFIQDATFTAEDMRSSIVRAINNARAAGDTTLTAFPRSSNTLFVENGVDISGIESFFLRGIQDLAGNTLRPNRINNETQFTILMPGSTFDFGDAPDPFTTTSGRYPTVFTSDGARHAVVGTDEVQVVGWTAGDPVVGTFKLTHGKNTDGSDATTVALPVNASAAAVQAALESLSTIGTGNVLVELIEQPSGSANVAYRLTFRNLRESLDVVQTTILLTAGATPVTPITTFEQTVTQGVAGLRLGKLINSEIDGRPSPLGDADASDDGVSFSAGIVAPIGLSSAGFNKSIVTKVTVTASGPGYLDGWIDFNFDGAWDAPGEQILVSREFIADNLTQTFDVTVPSTAPDPTSPTRSFARFRFSSTGGLQPTGLAIDGEVEDYDVTIIPGGPPVAVGDPYSTIEDIVGGLTISALNGVLANDLDPDSAQRLVLDSDPTRLGVQPFQEPQNGTLTLNADGSFNYVPNPFFNGIDTFVYFATDGILNSINPATVTITVEEINNPPIVPTTTINWGRDSVYNQTVASFLTTINATPGPANESNQTLSITRVDPTSMQNGTIVLSGGRIIYTPPAGFSGQDTFTFLVSDNGTSRGLSDPLLTTGTVTFTLTDRNDPPTANTDPLSVNEDVSISQPANFFLNNDLTGTNRNETGQSLAFTGVQTNSSTRGSLTFSGGNVTYTPPANFTGTDVFFYTITDNGLNGNGTDPQTATGTVTVTVLSVNDAPTVTTQLGSLVVNEDAADRTYDLNNYFGDVDITTAGDRLTFTVTTNRPDLVTPTINASGILNLDFLSDQNGTANVVVRATDLAGAFVTNTLTLTVTAQADPPRLVANIPDQNVQEGAGPLDIVVVPNFIFDPDVATNGDTLTLSVLSNSNPNLLSTTIVNGTTLRLTLAANRFGQSTIVVRGVDAALNEISDTFVVNVSEVNDPPTVQNRSYNVPANGSLSANDATGTTNSNPNDNGVLAGSTDIEGDSFTAAIVQQPTRGQIALNPNGTFVYTPNAGGTVGQTDTFTYRAVDSRGAQSATATVIITYTANNPSSHQNPTLRFDVNADGIVSPIDALIVINFLGRNGTTSTVGLPSPPPYRDVDGNFTIAPLDVLLVINELNRQAGRRAGGEGEATGFDAAPIVVSPQVASTIGTGSIDTAPSSFDQVLPMQDVVGPTAKTRNQAGFSLESLDIEEENASLLVDSFLKRKNPIGSDVDAALCELLGLD